MNNFDCQQYPQVTAEQIAEMLPERMGADEFRSTADHLGLSQTLLAWQLGKSVVTISKYRNNRLEIPPLTVRKFRRLVITLEGLAGKKI